MTRLRSVKYVPTGKEMPQPSKATTPTTSSQRNSRFMVDPRSAVTASFGYSQDCVGTGIEVDSFYHNALLLRQRLLIHRLDPLAADGGEDVAEALAEIGRRHANHLEVAGVLKFGDEVNPATNRGADDDEFL